MNNKFCATYCYIKTPSGYSYTDSSYKCHFLHVDFPLISLAFERFEVMKIVFLHNGSRSIAWRDKHQNIMLRVYHADTQTTLF